MQIDFGLHFFPDLSPAQKPADQFFAEALRVIDELDELGLSFVRIVEHYFEPYGGYSPNPLLFLTAASQRSAKARLIPGAMLPVFNHPLKMAGEIGMLDAISGGRVEPGFARAFLPHEFQRFGISMDESRARFNEGIEAVRLLLEQEHVSFDGEFTKFQDVTSLPRPTQTPCPPIWLAVLVSPESFELAGRMGYGIMGNAIDTTKLAELIGIYRDAWRAAGHPGNGRVMISFRAYCAKRREDAIAALKPHVEHHLRATVDAARCAGGWGAGTTSKDYPDYDKIIDRIWAETFEDQVAKGSVWVGTPDDVAAQARAYYDKVGGFEYASLNALPATMSAEDTLSSLRLISRHVIPQFAGAELAHSAA